MIKNHDKDNLVAEYEKSIQQLKMKIEELENSLSNCKCRGNNSLNEFTNYTSVVKSNVNQIKKEENQYILNSSNNSTKFTRFYSLDELKVMANDSKYKGMINIEYLSSKEGQVLLRILSEFNYETETKLNFKNSIIGDKAVE